MKTLFVCAAILIAAVQAADEEFPPEFKQKLLSKIHEVGAKCASEEKATPEDIKELLERKPPSRREGKCLIACFNQAFGSQDADGKPSQEGAIQAMQPIKAANENIYNNMVKLAQECMPEVKATERCEIAAEMAHCGNMKLSTYGLSPELLM